MRTHRRDHSAHLWNPHAGATPKSALSGYVCATRQSACGQHGARCSKHLHPTSLKSLLCTLSRCHETDLPHRSTCNRLLNFHDVLLWRCNHPLRIVKVTSRIGHFNYALVRTYYYRRIWFIKPWYLSGRVLFTNCGKRTANSFEEFMRNPRPDQEK